MEENCGNCWYSQDPEQDGTLECFLTDLVYPVRDDTWCTKWEKGENNE